MNTNITLLRFSLALPLINKFNTDTMLFNEFYPNRFIPSDEKQWSLMEDVKEYRSKFGITNRIQILKALARTRPYTRTVYPVNWKAS